MKKLLTLLFSLCLATTLTAATYDVAALGAKNDGVTNNVKIIQQAIDDCSAAGGGVVLLQGGGQYMTSTLYMKSYVTLRIESGTTLLASPNIDDYPTDTHKIMYKRESHMNRCFIYAENAREFSFEGYGTIDGNGHEENFPNTRPMLLRFKDCERIRINDLTLCNPAAWTSAILYCDDIVVSGIRIDSVVNKNGDGLDFDGCTNVRVSDSNFNNSDDCICLQTSRRDKPCKNVVITNCTFKTKWAGIRIGLLSMADISQVTVSNCTFNDILDSGLKIQQNEAGGMSDMTFTNLVMNNVPRPVLMTFCQQRACVEEPLDTLDELKYMKRFIFSNITVDNSMLDANSLFIFSGVPTHAIEDVTLSNVYFVGGGGGTSADAARADVPEFDLESMKHHWPEYSCLGGVLPASAIYARHVNGLTINNFTAEFVESDARPLVVTDDVENYTVTNVREKIK